MNERLDVQNRRVLRADDVQLALEIRNGARLGASSFTEIRENLLEGHTHLHRVFRVHRLVLQKQQQQQQHIADAPTHAQSIQQTDEQAGGETEGGRCTNSINWGGLPSLCPTAAAATRGDEGRMATEGNRQQQRGASVGAHLEPSACRS
eukprot:GHVU01061624.1.p2 GENE.GHVU01061624.1~~GHVU01061624.1.p2  ORF type:complete len:149 (+),score=23.97 GHVU01061624.1:33-479(+)